MSHESQAGRLKLHLRSRVELFKGSGEWSAVTVDREVPSNRCALLLCDVWDNHWCASAARRCGPIAHRLSGVVDTLREQGVQIIHAPSDCMEFYANSPERRSMLEVPPAAVPPDILVVAPPLPIDDSDGGCDDLPPCDVYTAWTRQDAAIRITPPDVISDKGQEVFNLIRAKGIELVMIAGVHTNMCVLGRSFGIRQLTRWGVRCALVRDLTDTMYNPRMPPHVTHDEGTRLVVEHIEQYWCPTLSSENLLAGTSA